MIFLVRNMYLYLYFIWVAHSFGPFLSETILSRTKIEGWNKSGCSSNKMNLKMAVTIWQRAEGILLNDGSLNYEMTEGI